MSAAAIVPAAGAAVAVSHAYTKLPRLVKWIQGKTSVPVGSSGGDLGIYAVRMAYHVRCNYPLSAWAELLLLVLYNGACVGCHRYGGSEDGLPWLRLAGDAVACSTLWCGLLWLPRPALRWLTLVTAPLLVGSYAGQALSIVRSRSAGQLTVRRVLRRWARSLARIFTVAAQLRGDAAVLTYHAVSAAGCTMLLLLLGWCLRGGGAASQALKAAPPPPPPARSYDYLLATLMWRSLGGFEDSEPARRLTRKRLRVAFDRLDADGSGAISLDELEQGIRTAARPGVSDAAIGAMLRAADVDGDGSVTFEEYAEIMVALGNR